MVFAFLTQACSTINEDWRDSLGLSIDAAHRDESDIPVEEGVLHIVKEGETLVRIAETYNITPQKLQRINNIADPDFIITGQRLWIPGVKTVLNVERAGQGPATTVPAQQNPPTPTPTPAPVVHVVQPGETLALIAETYDTSWKYLARVNNISDVRKIETGQELLIPGATEVRTVKVPTPTPTPKPGEAPVNTTQRAVDLQTGKALEQVELPSKAMGPIAFSWPIVDGYSVAQKFKSGGSTPTYGIDLEAPEGTPIYAAADGEVFLAGTPADDFGASWGNYIILYHGTYKGEGIRSIYAHTKENLVKAGDKVKRGQLIGYVGQTGRTFAGVNGPNLHFEVRRVEVPLDPLKLLPTP